MNTQHNTFELKQAKSLFGVHALTDGQVGERVVGSIAGEVLRSENSLSSMPCSRYDARFIATGLRGESQSPRGKGNWRQADRRRIAKGNLAT